MRAMRRFGHLMSSTVTIAARTGQDEQGKPSFGSAVTYRAHLSRHPTMVRSTDMNDVQSTQAVYLLGHPPILETAQVTLSTGDVGSTEQVLLQPTILSIDRLFDQQGPHHTVLRL